MVRCSKPPVRSSVRVRKTVVYAPKASCVVLCPQARMNFAQFCALLMTVDKKLKDKSKDSPQKGQDRNLKTKGSLISGPSVLQCFIKRTWNNFNFFKFIYYIRKTRTIYINFFEGLIIYELTTNCINDILC